MAASGITASGASAAPTLLGRGAIPLRGLARFDGGIPVLCR
jgi:hypothetical protein